VLQRCYDCLCVFVSCTQLNIAAGDAPAEIAKTGAPELKVLYIGPVNVRQNVDADDYKMLRRMCEVSASAALRRAYLASCRACGVTDAPSCLSCVLAL
jgi:hypothetical protein